MPLPRSRIVVPYVNLHPETIRALAPLDREVIWGPVFGDGDYFGLLRWLWRKGAAFTVVEQDIIPASSQLDELDACPEPWCGFAYANTDRYAAWLGCTRFRASLVSRYPDLFTEVEAMRSGYVAPRHWVWLADRVFAALYRHGERIHVHLPPVVHLNPRQQLRTETERGYCDWPAVAAAPQDCPVR